MFKERNYTGSIENTTTEASFLSELFNDAETVTELKNRPAPDNKRKGKAGRTRRAAKPRRGRQNSGQRKPKGRNKS